MNYGEARLMNPIAGFKRMLFDIDRFFYHKIPFAADEFFLKLV